MPICIFWEKVMEMNGKVCRQLIVKEYQFFMKNKLVYFLVLYVALESFRTINEFLGEKDFAGNGVFSLYQEGLIRAVQFPLVIFVLLSGFLLFSHYRREREPENRDVFFSKPIATSTVLLSRYVGVTAALETLYLAGVLISTAAAGILFNHLFRISDLLNMFFLLPFLSIVIWSVVLLLLSSLVLDYRVGLPLIFLMWFLSQLSSSSFIIHYHRISNVNLFLDHYMMANRSGWLIAGAALFCITALIYHSQRTMGSISEVKPKKKTSPAADNYEVRLIDKPFFAELWYSIRIYSGWKIVISTGVAAFLAVIFAVFAPAGLSHFLYLGAGEVFLSLLAILGTAGLSKVKRERNTDSFINSLPNNEKRILKQKLSVSLIYFLSTFLTYTFIGAFFLNNPTAQRTWIIAPTYLFFAVVTLVLSALSNSTVLGGATSGVLWFLPLILDRRYPYWLHPFYYFAEFDYKGYNFLLQNKIILLFISVALILLYTRCWPKKN